MSNVAVANRRTTPDWPYSDATMRLLQAAARGVTNRPSAAAARVVR